MLTRKCRTVAKQVCRLELERLESREMLQGDPILFWNNVALNAALVDSRAVGEQGGPTRTARALAIVHVAMFDAFNGTQHAPRFDSYLVQDKGRPSASTSAAVAQAAHDTLVNLYPAQAAAIDAILAGELDDVRAGRRRRSGVAYGQLVANQILAARQNDGANNPINALGTYSPGASYDANGILTSGDAGFHNVDPLNPAQGFLTPGWGSVKPFGFNSALEFRMPAFPEPGDPTSPASPDLISNAYTTAYSEVRCLGAIDSEIVPNPHPNCEAFGSRTDEQTEIGLFWGYDHRLGTPPRLYNQAARVLAAQQKNSVAENARLFALINIAMADAGIAAWDIKYNFDIWRPVLAIRNADVDGNAGTTAEPTWTPLGAPANNGDPAGFAGNAGTDADPDPVGGPDFTPPFPAYTSGHATFGAAAFRMIANFYGRDDLALDLFSEDSGTTRHLNSLNAAAAENGLSRIFLGIHWQQDNLQGQECGRHIADFIFENRLGDRAN